MNEALIKKERLDTIERIERQLEQLRGKRQSLYRDLSEAQQNVFFVTKNHDVSSERYRRLQDAMAAATHNVTEIHQLERQLERARETYNRDYPGFGRGG